jgi:hypothetical protein
MTFYEVLEQARELLQRHERLSYHALKRQFQLDDMCLEDLKAELVDMQRVAADQDGTMLVWAGDASLTPPPAAPAPAPERAPRASSKSKRGFGTAMRPRRIGVAHVERLFPLPRFNV